jgi:hypothetical protein
LLDCCPELLLDALAELLKPDQPALRLARPIIGFRVPTGRVVLHHRIAAGANPLLELDQLRLPQRLDLGINLTVDGLRYRLQGVRITQVKKGVAPHLRVLEHAVENLQLREALAGLLPNPAELFGGVRRVARRHPAVALAPDADEERPAHVDLVQTQIEHLRR